MNVALLGLRHPHAGALLSAMENMPEISRVFPWDAQPRGRGKALLQGGGKVAPVTADLTAVLTRCDFAIVCVPHDRAAVLAHAVIAAGKHLLAEKPVGLTAAEIAGVQRAARRAGVIASVLYPRRYHPCAIAMRRQAAALGPLLSLEARFLATQVQMRNPRSWLFRRSESGGGILLWLGCHYLDLLQHISGDEIIGVAARLVTRSGKRIDVEDTAALTLEFRSGAIGTFHAGYSLAFSGSGYLNASGYDAYLALNGRAGRMVWPDVSPRFLLELPSGRRRKKFQIRKTDSYAGAAGEAFIRRFLASLRGRTAPPTTMADALRTARIIEAAEMANRTGRFTRVVATPAQS